LLLLVGAWGNSFTVYDFASRSLTLRSTEEWFGQLSDDGQRVAVLDEHRGYGVRAFLNPIAIRRLRTPAGLIGHVNAAAWHPSGDWLVTGHSGGWSLWDPRRNELVVMRRTGACQSVQFHPSGRSFLTGGADGPVCWSFNVIDGRPDIDDGRRLLPRESGTNERAALSPDGTRFAAVGEAGAFIGDLAGREPPSPLQGGVSNCYVAYSPDGQWIYTGTHNGTKVNIHSAATDLLITNLAAGTGAAVFLTHREELLTMGPSEFTFWQLGTWQRLRGLPIQDATTCDDVAGFWTDGSFMLVNGRDGMLRLWDSQANREIACLRISDGSAAWNSVFDPSGQFMVGTGSNPFFHMWDFPGLRRELAHLGLDWPDGQPANGFVPQIAQWKKDLIAERVNATISSHDAWLPIWVALVGMLLAILFGLYMLAYQRRLFLAYADLDTLAGRQAGVLQEAQAALLHREKMQALGTMAAGVAHDFNNLLSVIRLSSELIEEQTAADRTTKENFQAIQQAVQRGRTIVNSMLGYARDDGQARPFASGVLISNVVALLHRPFLSALVLEIDIDPAAPEVLGRGGRVEQMLLNLVVNAAEAMEGRGTLRLGAREKGLPNDCVLEPAPAASYVELSVADTGPGILPEVLPRIFEPFFTTKNKGAQSGTGLGLSMLYTMAKEDGIGVAVNSEPGKGATFRLFLPVAIAVRTADPALSDPGSTDRGQQAAVVSRAAEASSGATRPLSQRANDGQA
jgi:signal transduction histidine kinase